MANPFLQPLQQCARSSAISYSWMKAIPCGLTIPVTMSVKTPVSASRAATEVGVALYAALGEKMSREIA